MKNIILVNPPVSIYLNKTAFAPLPLLVISSCLKEVKQNGFDIHYEILDLDFLIKRGDLPDSEEFYFLATNLILEKKPDILLFTIHGPNHILALKLAEQIKQLSPCLIVAGGVGPTLSAKIALQRCKDIDIIVKGEAEPVLKHLIPAAIDDNDFSGVPSIVYRNKGHVIENEKHNFECEVPIASPDYSLILIEDYLDHNKSHPYINKGFVLIESGRGCRYGCSFCAPNKMWNKKVRYRPVSEIIEEMEFLADKGGDFSFFTQDNLDESFLREFSDALAARKNKISWGCYSRLDRLPGEMSDLLSKAGCKIVFTGLETPNKNVQKKIRKAIDCPSTYEKIKKYNQSGIRLIASFIAGFSGETDDELEDTMRFAIECASGRNFKQLNQIVSDTSPDALPQAPDNICVIHPLVLMGGTDSFKEEADKLHISKYSAHPDCHGSYLFNYDFYKDDWSFLGANPYLSHLSEEQAGYYCSILRLFNFLNSRPYFYVLLMQVRGLGPLALLKEMAAQLGEEFVLSAKVDSFEQRSREYVQMHLDFIPKWTAKKGQ
jgi:radical SAM superfamily enzyme YgiQ (UPF0313 family)